MSLENMLYIAPEDEMSLINIYLRNFIEESEMSLQNSYPEKIPK